MGADDSMAADGGGDVNVYCKSIETPVRLDCAIKPMAECGRRGSGTRGGREGGREGAKM